jgi:putative oxidoreductase
VRALVGFLSDRRIVILCQLAIGLVFLFAAMTKIGDAAGFATQIHHYRLLPFGLENLTAITLPWIELLAALAILLRLEPRVGSAASAGLMVVFIVAVGLAVARGLDIECGCFGTADAGHVGGMKLLENTGFLALALVGCLRPRE